MHGEHMTSDRTKALTGGNGRTATRRDTKSLGKRRKEDDGSKSEELGEGKLKPMKAKEYNKIMKKLQGELVKVQLWLKHAGKKIIVVFEGRDAAGKGGVIKAMTERTSPRVFRIAA